MFDFAGSKGGGHETIHSMWYGVPCGARHWKGPLDIENDFLRRV
jgi:hypothetical protein